VARRKGRLHWFAWYPEDFHGDPLVRTMPPAARGAYRELLDHSWQVGPIVDPERVIRGLGWDPALWASDIRPCWTETPAGWIQKRLELERAEALGQSGRAVAANAVRWESKRNPNGPPNGLQRQSSPPPEPEPEPETLQPPVAPLPSGQVAGSGFAAGEPAEPAGEEDHLPRSRNLLKAWHSQKVARFPQLLEGRKAAQLELWENHLRATLSRPYSNESAIAALTEVAAWTPDELEAAVSNSLAGSYAKLVLPPTHGRTHDRTAPPQRPPSRHSGSEPPRVLKQI
jgi:hypothetical protein